ncbi:hypothetical protein MOQ72_29165 [Saccharopolyspora sp. K220]|uniref:hypothetical protein n=1 Tax=Saccharopolyspora soli TaxID=2926618 RepID=UPI001F58F1D8|nr:hypothetical protein [Saccharopolyspora soli]MCI2421512.1 hypothetical protein [Saccharopolyspora soli]
MAGSTRDLVFTVLGIDRASKTFDKVGDSIDRMGNRATVALAGVTAGSAAASAGVAAAVGALPLAFIGLGAVALRENTAVRGSFEDLSETVRTGLTADAAPLEAAFVGAAEDMGVAYEELRPLMRDAFAASVPYVDTLTQGVIGFARNAMPGMVTSVERAGPVVDALALTMEDAGVGVGDFFEIVSTGSEDAGVGIEHLGQLVRGVLPGIGGTLVGLTGVWAEHGDEVADVVTRIIGVINDLSGGALPVMSSAVGVALDVLSGVLNVIEPLSGALGPLIGLWLSLATAMRGIRAVREVVAGAATSMIQFNDNARRAAGGGNILATAGRGMLGVLGGPFGAALAAASVGLALFGSASQSAEGDQRSLSSALRDSAGAFDANARSALMQSEQYQDIADSVEAAGLSHEEYINALISGGPALDNLKARLQQQVQTAFEAQGSFTGVTGSLRGQADASTALLLATDGLRGTVVGAIDDQRQYNDAVFGAGSAMTQTIPGTDSLREAITTLGDSTADTADRVDALNTAWQQLFGIQISMDEATAGFEEGLDTLRESLDGVRGGTANWQAALFSADGQINLTTEEGRELHDNLVQQGEQYRTLAQTAYDTALRQGQSQQQATATAVAATEQRRAQFIAEAQQMGFTADQAQRLADRYFGIPRDVSTLITTPGAWEAMRAADGVRDAVNNIPRNRVIDIIFRSSGSGQSNPGSGIPLPFRAHGGPIASQRPVLVGEQGPELLVPSGPGRVLPAHETRRLLAQSGPSREPQSRATVNIGTFVAQPNQSPYDIAADLDWFARGGG